MRLITVLVFLMFFSISNAQKVFSTKYHSLSSVSLYETQNRWEADIVVCKVKVSQQACANKGLWYDCKYQYEADVIAYWTKYKSQADYIVYFTKYKSYTTHSLKISK